MEEQLTQRLELFIQNYEKIKNRFAWDNAMMIRLCANLFTAKNELVNIDNMTECKKILKNNAGVFSNLRGITKLYTIASLALEEQPEHKLSQIKQAYKCLKEELPSSSYMVVAAGVLVDFVEPSQYPVIAKRAKSIYKKLKSEHPILTGREDITFTVLFAISEREESYLLDEVESCYKLLKKHFHSSNDVQSLSFVLALGEGSAEDKCNRLLKLYADLEWRGCKFGKGSELASLGVLALVNEDTKVLAGEIVDASEYLRKQKGFGMFRVSRRERLMLAGILVMNKYVEQDTNNKMDVAAINGVISIVVAQQAATCAAMAAASASASAAAAN